MLARLQKLRNYAVEHVEPAHKFVLSNKPVDLMDLDEWSSGDDIVLDAMDPILITFAPALEIDKFPAKLEEFLQKTQTFWRTIGPTLQDNAAVDFLNSAQNQDQEPELSDSQEMTFAVGVIGEGEEFIEGIRLGASVPVIPESCAPYPNRVIETDMLGECYSFFPMRRTTHHPATVDDINKLDELIRKLNRVSTAVDRMINKIQRAGYNQKRRWKHGGLDGDKRKLMKSGGRKTRLAQSITIDEEWPDDWTLALEKESRNMTLGEEMLEKTQSAG
jgi:hypothetical protein